MVICRFVHFCAVLLMFGACAFRPLLLGAWPSVEIDQQLRKVNRVLAWVGLGSGVAWLLLTTHSMAGSWPETLEPATLWLVLGSTFFGQVWAFHLVLMPLQNGFSRILERAADRFALKAFPSVEAFISCMDKLATVNLAERDPHPVIEWLFFDHPAISKRIQMARDFKP